VTALETLKRSLAWGGGAAVFAGLGVVAALFDQPGLAYGLLGAAFLCQSESNIILWRRVRAELGDE
jgi:hypothetical protein